MKTGRKPKPFITSNGQIIPGLCKLEGNRWRITSDGPNKGFRFSAVTEADALKTFRKIVGGIELVTLRSTIGTAFPTLAKLPDAEQRSVVYDNVKVLAKLYPSCQKLFAFVIFYCF